MNHQNPEGSPAERWRFPLTNWSWVQMAGRDPADTKAREALARLCEQYWYPLYAYARHQGHSPHDAEDLVQGFFAWVLEKKALGAADQQKGKFRTYLQVSFNNYRANEWRRANAQKRGGGARSVPLDAASAETRFCRETADPADPEQIYLKNWAIALLEGVLAQLREEQKAKGKLALFEQLKDRLMGDDSASPYAALAAQLGESEANLRAAVRRLRRKFNKLLRQTIAPTVGSPAEIEEEIRFLCQVLGR